MKRPFPMIYRLATLSLAALLLLSACASASDNPPSSAEPHTPCHEPFTPSPLSDTTYEPEQYRALAEAVFEGIEAANPANFTHEAYGDGVKLLTYVGEGGKIIVPDQIEGKAVVALGDGLFLDNTTLTALSIPDSVTEIGSDLLSGCRSLQVLRIPQLGAKRNTEGYLSYFFGGSSPIGTGFRVPSSLDTIILSSAVSAIPDRAFYECARVRMVFSDATVDSIGEFAFYGCAQLHTVELGTPESIGNYAFGNCTSMKYIDLRDSAIGEGILYGCTGLEHVTLHSFGENISHLGVLFGAETHMWNAAYVPQALRFVSVEDGNIPDNAFYGCDYLASVELANTKYETMSIGSRAFYGCTSLQYITLPDSVTSIGELAFAHCTTLASVTLSSSLTDLGIQAFMGCTNLTSIALPDRLSALSASTFADCCNLQTITLGADLTEIGAQAFRNCVSLASVTGKTTGVQIGQGNECLALCLN